MTEDNSTVPTRMEPTPAELKEWERLYGDWTIEPEYRKTKEEWAAIMDRSRKRAAERRAAKAAGNA